MATAGAIPGWYYGTTPKVVDRIHAALNASRTEKFWCAKDLREAREICEMADDIL